MRGPFVAENNSPRVSLFPFGFAFRQDAHKVGQARKLCVLFGDDLVQLVDCKRQVRDGFF